MRKLIATIATMAALAAPAVASAAASWSAGDPVSPLTHETLRIRHDWYVATVCSHRTYDWIGEEYATVDGRFADILYGNTVVFFADHDQVIGEVAWTPGTHVCVTVYDLLFDRPISARLQIKDARVVDLPLSR